MKIYQPSDRVELTVGKVKFIISPLTYGQKVETSAYLVTKGGEITAKMRKMTYFIVKNCVKELKGVEDIYGEPYKLEFEDKDFVTFDDETESSKVLTEACARDLVSCLALSTSLNEFSYQLLNGIPDEIVDEKGKKLKGVKIEPLGKPQASKRKKMK